jgi:hypothetical protein
MRAAPHRLLQPIGLVTSCLREDRNKDRDRGCPSLWGVTTPPKSDHGIGERAATSGEWSPIIIIFLTIFIHA